MSHDEFNYFLKESKAAISYDYEYKRHKIERVVTEIENEIMKKYNTPKTMIVVSSIIVMNPFF